MCFSNLPIEFDEHGNPYLADEAEDVERPGDAHEDEAPLDEDPEAAYAEIVASVPESVRESLADGRGAVETVADGSTETASGRDDERESTGRESAGGD